MLQPSQLIWQKMPSSWRLPVRRTGPRGRLSWRGQRPNSTAVYRSEAKANTSAGVPCWRAIVPAGRRCLALIPTPDMVRVVSAF